jgi:hypothetical protein
MPITAELAFQQAANRAADTYATRPAYVTYHVDTRVRAPSLGQDRSVARAVMTRTHDDLAVLQDLPAGRNVLARSFPVPPTFDALSYFRFEWHVTARGTLDAYVADVSPIRYDLTPKSERTDVFVAALRAYRAVYAADSSDAPGGITHIVLTAYDFVRAEGKRSSLYLTDTYIDNASGLPVDVRMAGDDGLVFEIRYTVADNHWVVDKIHYEETLHPLTISSIHVIADAAFTDYGFPLTAPDPRLIEPGTLPPSAPTPLPTGALTPVPAPT